MDFNKLNTMMDELNKTFDIVKENTERIEEENLNAKKELFYKTLEYFANWGGLFQKCNDCERFITIFTNDDENRTITMRICSGTYIGNIYFGNKSAVWGFSMKQYNPKYADKEYFPTRMFKSEVVPTIQSINYDYVERTLMDKLNEEITKKAEKIEAEYNKAMQEA